MLHNDNEFDQLFRDRLRDHSSPVRADLWRRVHTGIGSTARRLHPWRSLRYFGGGAAMLIAALAAAHYVYVLHSPSHRVAQSVHRVARPGHGVAQPGHGPESTANHYSTINSGIGSADSDRSAVAADQAAAGPTQSGALPGAQSAALPGNHLNPGSDSNRGEIAPIKPGSIAGASREGVPPTGSRSGYPTDRTADVGHPGTGKIARPARGTARTSDITGTPSGTPARRRNIPVDHRTNPVEHRPNPVTLPAMARLSSRPAISTGRAIATLLPTLAKRSKPPTMLYPRARIHNPDDRSRPPKVGYISLYGSVDFPSNHYYTWSYTAGGTVTIQFSRRWSGTSGFEYGRVNVPTQVVPPILPFDTLHAFYFSNYEVPVLIGYTRMLGSYALTVNCGAILNLQYRQSNSHGNLVTSSTSTWVFNWPDRDSYGAYLGADIFRPLGHSLRVFAQPYARYSISNYRMFIPVQRFSYGALLGVRYQL